MNQNITKTGESDASDLSDLYAAYSTRLVARFGSDLVHDLFESLIRTPRIDLTKNVLAYLTNACMNLQRTRRRSTLTLKAREEAYTLTTMRTYTPPHDGAIIAAALLASLPTVVLQYGLEQGNASQAALNCGVTEGTVRYYVKKERERHGRIAI